MFTLNQSPGSMYGPKFCFLKGFNTFDLETLNMGKQYIVLYGAVWNHKE
jgi:hypothetical protein